MVAKVITHPTEPAEPASVPAGSGMFESPAAFSGRKSRVGLDVLLTKAAVDFQNFHGATIDGLLRQNLEALRDAIGLDCIFIAHFDDDRQAIAKVVSAASLFTSFNPE